MLKLQLFFDKTAIGLSLLCTLHCLALPLLLVLFPSVVSLQLDNELFHFWMILAVIPTSIYALTTGCQQHKRLGLLKVGLVGLAFLLSAVFLPESLANETSEKIFTLIGAGLIAFGHFRNYRLCQHKHKCACTEHHLSKPR